MQPNGFPQGRDSAHAVCHAVSSRFFLHRSVSSVRIVSSPLFARALKLVQAIETPVTAQLQTNCVALGLH